MDNPVVVLGCIAFVVIFVVAAWRLIATRPLDGVNHAIPDRDGKHVHVLASHTVMPDDSDNVTTYYHYVMDADTLAMHAGNESRGENLDLESRFVAGSIEMMAKKLGVPLALDTAKRPSLAITKRDGRATDTEVDQPLPADGIVVWRMSREPPRMEIELRRQGRTVCRGSLPGETAGPDLVELPGARFLLFYTRQKMGVRIGAGLAVISETGIEDRGFVRVRPKRS